MRVFIGTCPFILVPRAIFCPLLILIQQSCASVSLTHFSIFYHQFLFLMRLLARKKQVSRHEAAVLPCACPGLGTRGSIAQGRVPGLSARQTGKQSFQYHVLSAAARRYVHQAMVGGAGRALVQPELGLGARVEFCQREKEDKCDRVPSCPP